MQADNEPICIDSDEDDHATGSAPARESDQNGAGPELRRSERTNLNQSTTVKFKVPAATVKARDLPRLYGSRAHSSLFPSGRSVLMPHCCLLSLVTGPGRGAALYNTWPVIN